MAWFVFPTSPSGTEALPPAWNECYGVYQSYPHPEDQSGARLCAEGTDQRTGKVPSILGLTSLPGSPPGGYICSSSLVVYGLDQRSPTPGSPTGTGP